MEDSLFIAHGERDTGYITSAEIRKSKTSSHKFIYAKIKLGVEEIPGVIGRTVYTSFVVRYGLDEDTDVEEENVALMIGQPAKIKWEHQMHIDNTYIGYRVWSVG